LPESISDNAHIIDNIGSTVVDMSKVTFRKIDKPAKIMDQLMAIDINSRHHS